MTELEVSLVAALNEHHPPAPLSPTHCRCGFPIEDKGKGQTHIPPDDELKIQEWLDGRRELDQVERIVYEGLASTTLPVTIDQLARHLSSSFTSHWPPVEQAAAPKPVDLVMWVIANMVRVENSWGRLEVVGEWPALHITRVVLNPVRTGARSVAPKF